MFNLPTPQQKLIAFADCPSCGGDDGSSVAGENPFFGRRVAKQCLLCLETHQIRERRRNGSYSTASDGGVPKPTPRALEIWKAMKGCESSGGGGGGGGGSVAPSATPLAASDDIPACVAEKAEAAFGSPVLTVTKDGVYRVSYRAASKAEAETFGFDVSKELNRAPAPAAIDADIDRVLAKAKDREALVPFIDAVLRRETLPDYTFPAALLQEQLRALYVEKAESVEAVYHPYYTDRPPEAILHFKEGVLPDPFEVRLIQCVNRLGVGVQYLAAWTNRIRLPAVTWGYAQ